MERLAVGTEVVLPSAIGGLDREMFGGIHDETPISS
jgi:hypothetical protein